MIVFSVHERPILTFEGNIYHPYSNVITKYFALADKISYGVGNSIEISKGAAEKLEKISNPNIRFVHLNRINSLKSFLFSRRKNWEILDEEIKKSDIIVARLPSFTGLQAVEFAKKYKKPYMVEVIGCAWDGYWNYNLKGKIIAPFLFFSTQNAIKHATHAVYVTQEFLQKRYPCNGKSIGASNVCIYPNDKSILHNRIERIRNMSLRCDREISIATSAGIDNPVKGHEYVIRAISSLNKEGGNYHYYIIGGGEKSRLESIARKLGIINNVHFVGQLQQDEVLKYLNNIDIYVQPSKQEGLPRALIEAMHQGCPSIGSSIAGIPELLEKECLFKKGNVNELILRIKQMTPDQMIQHAHYNYRKAQEYLFDAISLRRKKFFEEFLSDHNMI